MNNVPTGAELTESFRQAATCDIQVSGSKSFEPYRWREAILHYLNGVWADKEEVTYRPKISFANLPVEGHVTSVCLRLFGDEYHAYGSSALTMPDFPVDQVLSVGPRQADVEHALIRFVRNDKIRALVVCVGNFGCVRLWKTKRRSELGVAAEGIPTDLGEWGYSIGLAERPN